MPKSWLDELKEELEREFAGTISVLEQLMRHGRDIGAWDAETVTNGRTLAAHWIAPDSDMEKLLKTVNRAYDAVSKPRAFSNRADLLDSLERVFWLALSGRAHHECADDLAQIPERLKSGPVVLTHRLHYLIESVNAYLDGRQVHLRICARDRIVPMNEGLAALLPESGAGSDGQRALEVDVVQHLVATSPELSPKGDRAHLQDLLLGTDERAKQRFWDDLAEDVASRADEDLPPSQRGMPYFLAEQTGGLGQRAHGILSTRDLHRIVRVFALPDDGIRSNPVNKILIRVLQQIEARGGRETS